MQNLNTQTETERIYMKMYKIKISANVFNLIVLFIQKRNIFKSLLKDSVRLR